MPNAHFPPRHATPPTRAPSGAAVQLWPIAMLLAIALIAHARAITGGFIWDDDDYVTSNQTLKSVDGLRRIWFEPKATPQYYPLVHTSYWIEYRLWGLNPLGYHAVNVALHAISSVLLWTLLKRLSVPGALFAAALFAAHPVGVESVAWVTERKNTLSMLFALASALAWLQYRFGDQSLALSGPLATVDATQQGGSRVWLVAAMVLFMMSLFSKTVAAMLVGILAALVWWKTGRFGMRDVRALLPLVIVGVPLALLTVWLEKTHVGADGMAWTLTPADRVVVAGRAATFYAGKLMAPVNLAFFYERWDVDAREAWQWLFPLGWAAVGIFTWMARSRLGRGAMAGVVMFLIALFPALGFFDVYPFKYSFVADHFAYHAMPVFLACGAAALTPRPGWLPSKVVVIAPVIVGVLMSLSFLRCGVFHDLETLYIDTLSKTPSCGMAANNLGTVYRMQDRVDDAIVMFTRAAELCVFDDERSRALRNLAICHLRRDDPEAAVPAGVLAHMVHRDLWTRGVLALCYVRAGRLDEARMLLDELPPGDEDKPDLLLARAEMALADGRWDDAAAVFQPYTDVADATERNIRLLDTGIAYAHHGRHEEAERYLLAVRDDPRRESRARTNLGVSLARAGKISDATEWFRAAVKVDPSLADAHGNLAKALMVMGRRDEALSHFERARVLAGKDFAFAADYQNALNQERGP